MQKGTLIIGLQATGKTYKMKEIAKQYPREHTVQIFSDSIFYINEDTQLVLRDEVLTIGSVNYWKQNICGGIFKANRIIRPKIVLISNSITAADLAKLPFDVAEFFEVIECSFNPNFHQEMKSMYENVGTQRPTVPPSAPKQSSN